MNSINFMEIQKRRTFAIVAHPDAGKTTITEKILFLGNVIHSTGTVKAKKSGKYVKSDWMKIEQERGISITSSIMQFNYDNYFINLLDTPGHEDFSEDTYRILTAVDCCLMVIDAAKGIETRTKKLMHIIEQQNTPIVVFINKLDRNSKNPIELLDEIESKLKITCIPITWPIGIGSRFYGIYHFIHSEIYIYKLKARNYNKKDEVIKLSDIYDKLLDQYIGVTEAKILREEIELINISYCKFNKKDFVNRITTPVFFGSALCDIGIIDMFNFLVYYGPSPKYKSTDIRIVQPEEKHFTGFVFKIQANMDLKHRDRIAFVRIVSGKYYNGIKLQHVRTGSKIIVHKAMRFLSGDRKIVEDSAYPGDIIGIYNHGSVFIGDTFTEGEIINFIGIPYFSPEIFRLICLKYPLQKKQLYKGLSQLSEEGAIQIFRPITNNNLIIGVIGILQLDIVVERLRIEYKIEVIYKNISIVAIRWIVSNDVLQLKTFKDKYKNNLALDNNNHLVYLVPSFFNLSLIIDKHPNIIFNKIREN
ncbi:Peptide chain release factor RF3 [Buchnera aphidicola (Eriosoma lanigerum)]|uniref:peptide chain release factor 3 n=1 Tax=Buchnera aphidicola TaxID=9 RepID=UPI003463B95B